MLGALRGIDMRSLRPRRPLIGLTMIELIITLTIGAILLALAVPSMHEYIARKRVSGTAIELAADIRLARSMVQQQNQPIWLNFFDNLDFSCYVLYTEGNTVDYCDCARTLVPMCSAVGSDAPVALRSVFIKSNTGIKITASGRNLQYTKPVGAPVVWWGGTAEAEVDGGTLGGRVRVIMTGLTKASICSVSGHTAEFGDC